MHSLKLYPLVVVENSLSSQTISDGFVSVDSLWQACSQGDPGAVRSPRTTELKQLSTTMIEAHIVVDAGLAPSIMIQLKSPLKAVKQSVCRVNQFHVFGQGKDETV